MDLNLNQLSPQEQIWHMKLSISAYNDIKDAMKVDTLDSSKPNLFRLELWGSWKTGVRTIRYHAMNTLTWPSVLLGHLVLLKPLLRNAALKSSIWKQRTWFRWSSISAQATRGNSVSWNCMFQGFYLEFSDSVLLFHRVHDLQRWHLTDLCAKTVLWLIHLIQSSGNLALQSLGVFLPQMKGHDLVSETSMWISISSLTKDKDCVEWLGLKVNQDHEWVWSLRRMSLLRCYTLVLLIEWFQNRRGLQVQEFEHFDL